MNAASDDWRNGSDETEDDEFKTCSIFMLEDDGDEEVEAETEQVVGSGGFGETCAPILRIGPLR